MPETIPNTALGDAIEESGLRKGFIARQIGVHQSEISKWLSGERVPSTVQREKLALLLRRKPDEFLTASHDAAASPADTDTRTAAGENLDEAA